MSDDDSLLRLEIMHFERFVSQHGGVYGVGGGRGLHAAPIKSQKAALTLPPGSMEQLAQFQKEERQRYASPDQAYVYSLRNGAKATVSPIAKKSAAVGKVRGGRNVPRQHQTDAPAGLPPCGTIERNSAIPSPFLLRRENTSCFQQSVLRVLRSSLW